MTRLQRLTGLIVCGYLSWAGSARADAVTDWNAIAAQAIIATSVPRPGPSNILDMATVQVAVYEAVEAIDGRFRPYHLAIPGASGSPFILTSPTQFRASPPPALTSDRYARDYNEVKALGALSNSARTPEQTDLAYFWAANYLVLLNKGLRDIANAHVHNIGESARLFALANMAFAD